jgi:hypothetical protein
MAGGGEVGPARQNGVAGQVFAHRPGIAGDPQARGARDAAAFGLADGAGGVVDVAARLDFDKRHRAAAPRDNVDLAAIHAVAALDDAVALADQERRGEKLGAQAEEMRPLFRGDGRAAA